MTKKKRRIVQSIIAASIIIGSSGILANSIIPISKNINSNLTNKTNNSFSNLATTNSANSSSSSSSNANLSALLGNKYLINDNILNLWNQLGASDTFSNISNNNTYNLATNGANNVQSYWSWFTNQFSSSSSPSTSTNFSMLNTLLNDHFLVNNPSIGANSTASPNSVYTTGDSSMSFSTNSTNSPGFNLQVNPYFVNGLYNLSTIFNNFATLMQSIIQPSNTQGSTTGNNGYPQFGSMASLSNDNNESYSGKIKSLINIDVIKANINYLFLLVASGCFENTANSDLSTEFSKMITRINGFIPSDNSDLASLMSAAQGGSANVHGQYFCPPKDVDTFSQLNIYLPINLLATKFKKATGFPTSGYISIYAFLNLAFSWLSKTLGTQEGTSQETLYNYYFASNTSTAPTSIANYNYNWATWINTLLQTANTTVPSSTNTPITWNYSTQPTYTLTNNNYLTNYNTNFFIQDNDSFCFTIGYVQDTLQSASWFNNVLNYKLSPLTMQAISTLDINNLSSVFCFSYVTQSAAILDENLMSVNVPSSLFYLRVNLGDLINYPRYSAAILELDFNQNGPLKDIFAKATSYNDVESLSLNYDYWIYNGFSNANNKMNTGWLSIKNGGDEWQALNNYDTQDSTYPLSISQYFNSSNNSSIEPFLGNSAWNILTAQDLNNYFPSTFIYNDAANSSNIGLETSISNLSVQNISSNYDAGSLFIYNYTNQDVINAVSLNDQTNATLNTALNNEWWNWNTSSSFSGMKTSTSTATTIWENVSNNLANTTYLNVSYNTSAPASLDVSNLGIYSKYDYNINDITNNSTYTNEANLTSYTASILNYTYHTPSVIIDNYTSSATSSNNTISLSNNLSSIMNKASSEYAYYNVTNQASNVYTVNLNPSEMSNSGVLQFDPDDSGVTSIPSIIQQYMNKTGYKIVTSYIWEQNTDPVSSTSQTDLPYMSDSDVLNLPYTFLTKALTTSPPTPNLTFTYKIQYEVIDTATTKPITLSGNSTTVTNPITLTLSLNLSNSYMVQTSNVINQTTYNTYLITSITQPLSALTANIFNQTSNDISVLNKQQGSDVFSNDQNLSTQILSNNPTDNSTNANTSTSANYFYSINPIFSNRYNASGSGYSISQTTYNNEPISYTLADLMSNTISINSVTSYNTLSTYSKTLLTNYFIPLGYSSNNLPTTNLNNGIYVALISFNGFDSISNGILSTPQAPFYLYNLPYTTSSTLNTTSTNSNIKITNNQVTIPLSAISALSSFSSSSPSKLLNSTINNTVFNQSNDLAPTILTDLLNALIYDDVITQNYNANLDTLVNNGTIYVTNTNLTNSTLSFNLVLPAVSYPSGTISNNNTTINITLTGFNTPSSEINNLSPTSTINNNIKQHNEQINTANTLVHNGLIIGLGVGIPVGILVLCFIIWIIALGFRGKFRHWKFIKNKSFNK